MSSAADNIKPGTVIAERYRVVRQLGRGGMGAVFLVEHVHTDEQWALKILNASVASDKVAIERFRREARTPARINSDHVVRVTDADVAADLHGVPFLVMEYLRGEGLEKRVEQAGPLPPDEVVQYMRQVARALDKAHALGIIHRDLKPENLFITQREDGTACIKILDFGIAKVTGDASRELVRSAATTTGQIFGTPLYMSPEQAKADSSKVCPQTDVWAMGIITHRLLTCKDIWTAETITHLIAQIAYEPMPVPSEHGSPYGHDFDAWFATCCAREASERYSSAGEAVTALAKALGVTEIPLATDRHTGRFVIEKLLQGVPSTNAVTLIDLQASLLGEGPSSDPVPRTSQPTDEETQRKSSAGPLTLTGEQKAKLEQHRPAPDRKRFVAAVGLLCVAAAIVFLMRSPAQQPSTNQAVASQDKPVPTQADVAVSPGGQAPVVAPSASAKADPAPVPTAVDAGSIDAGGADAAVVEAAPAASASASAAAATTRPTTTTSTPTKTKRTKTFDPLAGRH